MERRTSRGWGKSCRNQMRKNLAELPNGISYVTKQWTSCHGTIQAKVASEHVCHQRIPSLQRSWPKTLPTLKVYGCRARSRKMQNWTEWVGQVIYDITGAVFTCPEKNKMEIFKGGLNTVSPGSWQPYSCLSLESALLDSVFIHYFHRNKHTTYTLDDQEIWQPEKNYMFQEDDCKFFSL